MKKAKSTLTFSAAIIVLFSTNAQAQTDEILVIERGGLQIWSQPQPAPHEGLLATKVILRTEDPNAAIRTFTNAKLEGDLIHTWLEGPFGVPTPHAGLFQPGTVFGIDWTPYDSHLLVTPGMVGGGAGGGFAGITETNDGALVLTEPLDGPADSLRLGYGDLLMEKETDAFFLIPAHQSNEVDWAYLLTHETESGPGEVYFTLGILGSFLGEPQNKSGDGRVGFGFNGDDRVLIPFQVPEPTAVNLWMAVAIALVLRSMKPKGLLGCHAPTVAQI